MKLNRKQASNTSETEAMKAFMSSILEEMGQSVNNSEGSIMDLAILAKSHYNAFEEVGFDRDQALALTQFMISVVIENAE